MSNTELQIRAAISPDLEALEEIRAEAFAPVFASFRAILGGFIYDVAQAKEDASQKDVLAAMFEADSDWVLHTALLGPRIAGFIATRADPSSRVAEIGLNAVHPDFAGKGIGTAMYEFALDRFKAGGMLVATVATGGDPSHAPARRAYEKVGFDVQIPSVWYCKRL